MPGKKAKAEEKVYKGEYVVVAKDKKKAVSVAAKAERTPDFHLNQPKKTSNAVANRFFRTGRISPKTPKLR